MAVAIDEVRASLRSVKAEPQLYEEPPLFRSARHAIRFAVTRVGGAGRPLASRMTDRMASGNWLSLTDGAAQAGMIMSVIHRLGRIAEAALIAASAPHSYPCACTRPCCSGKAMNWIWNEAVNTLCDGMMIFKMPAVATLNEVNALKPWFNGALIFVTDGKTLSQAEYADGGRRWIAELLAMGAEKVDIAAGIRLGALIKIYGRDLPLVKIADQAGVHADTVAKYHRAIHRWLRGSPAGKHSDAVKGVESLAWEDAESALRDAGIVG